MWKYFLLILFHIGIIPCFGQSYDSEIDSAQKGNPVAQWWVGSFYERGEGGVEKNYESAFEWYKKSANQGYAKAQAALAFFYENGLGTNVDNRLAFLFYKKAADQGHSGAQRNLGLFYELGKGVAKDLNQATFWYEKSAKQGSTVAKRYLARVKKKLEEQEGESTPKQSIKETTPFILVDSYSLDGYGGTLQKKQQFDLTINIKNKNEGTAEDVNIKIVLPKGTLLLDNNDSVSFSNIKGNETKTLVYPIIIHNNYTASTLPISVLIQEKHGKYAKDWNTELTIGQPFPNSENGIMAESDIDIDIPETSQRQEDTYVLIISEENYRREETVPFAINDGRLFKEYCIKTLGIPQKNIKFEKDVTKNEFIYYLQALKNLVNLNEHPENVKILFYYAGHGVPDETDLTAHILFIDGFGNNVESGLNLQQLYQEFAQIKAKSISVFLDACFSGHKRDGGMINSSRGVAIKPKGNILTSNITVFSASKDNEAAYSYQEKKHGMFTYYLLKKLKDTSGDVTLGDLSQYLTREVMQTSLQLNNKVQTPSVSSGSNKWQQWRLK